MKTQLIAASAAAAVLAAGVAHAAPAQSRFAGATLAQTFAERARAKAETLVNTCGVDLARQGVTVQAYVGGEGRLKSVQVVGSLRPREADRLIEQAIRAMPLEDVPVELVDARLTFHFGAGADQVR